MGIFHGLSRMEGEISENPSLARSGESALFEEDFGSKEAVSLAVREIADPRSLRILEFDKIVQMVAARTATNFGKEKALLCAPLDEKEEILKKQRETSEAHQLLSRLGGVSFGGIRDIRGAVKRAKMGGVLSTGELLEVAGTFSGGKRLKKSLLSADDNFPIIGGMAKGIGSFSEIEEEILRCIDEAGEVKDDASFRLKQIRGEERRLQERIREYLESIIRSPRYQPMLQEPIITSRNDRYVIPVKQEYKGRFEGIVHDESASGATLFMEPFAVVEMNNRLKSLQSEEKEEVYQILKRLSTMIGDEAVRIEATLEILAELDYIFARARLSLEEDGTEPIFNEGYTLDLRGARHPLLGKGAVPIDIHLGKDFDILILTGPNTGGKTVTLKTVGLLTLMAQAGLHIPAKAGSEVAIFKRIFADIGDEQSIEQNLSTFSSHMKQIIQILREAGEGSLVLLDELGAGTDPTEGAALAMAILEYLGTRAVRLVATTHYSELKTFAYLNERVENASVEFDVETLSPTYRLIIGVPGRSNAFIIAKRLGMPPQVIERAGAFLTHEDLKIDELIKRIEENRQVTEFRRREAEALSAELRQMEREYRKRLETIQESRKAILQAAREEGEKVVEEGKRLIEELISKLRRAAPEDVNTTSKEMREALQQYREEMERSLRDMDEANEVGEEYDPSNFTPGTAVLVKNLNQRGTVLQAPNSAGQVLIQAGIMRVSVPVRDLEVLTEKEVRPEKSNISQLTVGKGATVSPEIMLRGMTVEEALNVLDKYLDDAYLAGLEQVRIIHGKGTGTLRRVVAEYLKNHRHIQEFRLGDHNEGGIGVTVAKFRSSG